MAAKLVNYYYLLILYNKNIQNIYRYKFNDMYLLYILQQLIIKILKNALQNVIFNIKKHLNIKKVILIF